MIKTEKGARGRGHGVKKPSSFPIPRSPFSVPSSLRHLVGGVNSPVRAFRQVGGEPLILIRGKGPEVTDSRGRTLIDFIGGWGALLLGHNPPVVVRSLEQALRRGILMGLTHPAEGELARLIAEAVPSVEQVRFTTSGTEACLTAVKLARAHTGRAKILAFEGCYHGHGESLMAGKSAGLPEDFSQSIVRIPFNDIGALEEALRHEGSSLAGAIIEPVAANMGVIAPEGGYLARLRELTRAAGIVLIFDEVVTGFRLGLGGAQERFGVQADLTAFGKIIGGGLPIGAVGGKRNLMSQLAPEGEVFHGGTFAGHPLSMSAGAATLRFLRDRSPYDRLERISQRLADGLAEEARSFRIPLRVNQAGSMLSAFFTEAPVRDFTQAQGSDRNRFAHWANTLRQSNILVAPSPLEALFVSSAHTAGHIERLLRVSRAAFQSMKR